MTRALYDGSFFGLLQLVYDSYYRSLQPQSVSKTGTQSALFTEDTEVITNKDEALKVLGAITEKLGCGALQNIKIAFLHDSAPLEMEIFDYIRLGFRDPRQLKNQTITCVKAVDSAVLGTLKEKHKYLGFVRFKQTKDGDYYAPIAPKNCILPLLAEHFTKRLCDQKFIIHDKTRGLALLYDMQHAQILEVCKFENPINHADEEIFATLWKSYFDKISIQERSNKRLQRAFAPLRYREFMGEFSQ